jgi:hypothetical protein
LCLRVTKPEVKVGLGVETQGQGRSGVGLGSVWGRSGLGLGSVWARSGLGLGSVQAGLGLGQGRFGKVLGRFRGGSGGDLGAGMEGKQLNQTKCMIFGVAGWEPDPAPCEERQGRAGSAFSTTRNSLRSATNFLCYGFLRRVIAGSSWAPKMSPRDCQDAPRRPKMTLRGRNIAPRRAK